MGELVVDLDSTHKRPYETIIIGRKKNNEVQAQSAATRISHSVSDTFGPPVVIEDNVNTKGSPQKTTCECSSSTVHENNFVGIPVSRVHEECKDTGNPEKISNFSSEKHGISVDDLKHRKPIPDHLVICSVPCQLHSRKPPLNGMCTLCIGFISIEKQQH